MKPKFNLNITIMKNLQKTTVLFLLALLMTSFSTSQVVVAEKLNAPETNIQNISKQYPENIQKYSTACAPSTTPSGRPLPGQIV